MNPMPRLARLAVAMTTAALVTTLAHAAAPAPKGQAPGWFRMMLGDFEVTALSDGTVDLPVDKLLTNITPAKAKALLAKAHLSAPVETSVNGYLVNTGGKLVLIDAGTAGLFGPTLGKLVANLEASGYKPEQVDEIYVTHLHVDHVGGITGADGKAVFPNATIRLDAKEAGFWLDEATMNKSPKEMHDFFKGAMVTMKPYTSTGKLKTFDATTAGVELVPGVSAMAARGHTPGHTIYKVQSKGQTMVVWGDLMHVAAVQFAEPSATFAYDIDSKAAAPQRKKAYAEAAKNNWYAAAAHVSFPGIGRLRAEGSSYRWMPVEYSANRPAAK